MMRRVESVSLLVVALGVALAAGSAIWLGLTGGTLLAWHLVVLAVGRSWMDPLPLVVLAMPCAILHAMLGEVPILGVLLPIIPALILSTVISTSDFLPGRLMGAALALMGAGIGGAFFRPVGPVVGELVASGVAVLALEVVRSAVSAWLSWRRPGNNYGGFAA